MTDLPLHMPCGCPYPKLGDHLPCEHGNTGSGDPAVTDPVPAAALAAAAEACPFVNRDALARALTAASPHIAAAERERFLADIPIGTRELRHIGSALEELSLPRGTGCSDVLLHLWKTAYVSGRADEHKHMQDTLRFGAGEIADLLREDAP